MPLGTAVRGALGRLEPTAARLYRNLFIDLGSLAGTLRSVAPKTNTILEIGCGDGDMATALNAELPQSALLGIDPGHPEPGRMYAGDRALATFRRLTSSQLVGEHPAPFDLVVLVDVLHHVPDEQRAQVLQDAAALTAPGGTLAVKEWEDRAPMGTMIAYAADRWITGDAGVRFMARPELEGLISAATAGWTLTCEARVPPRRANLLLALRRPD